MELTTDGHKAYLNAVEDAFGNNVVQPDSQDVRGDAPKSEQKCYSQAVCTRTKKPGVVNGKPDKKHISTSYVKRPNLSMRIGMRRFTRLTNAFSKKINNRIHILSLYFVHYNFCRIHKTLKVTKAMEAVISDTLRDVEWIIELIDALFRLKLKNMFPTRPKIQT